jgi:hypothetical protein
MIYPSPASEASVGRVASEASRVGERRERWQEVRDLCT